MGKPKDHFTLFIANVFDVMESSRWHKKHLAGGEDEAVSGLAVAGNRNQVLSSQAISQLVRICMPVRLSNTLWREKQTANRKSIKLGKTARVDTGLAAKITCEIGIFPVE